MERIGLVSKDPHLHSELTKWLVEIPGEFELVSVGPPATADPPAVLHVPGSADDEANKPKFRFVIFDSSSGLQLSKLRDELNLTDVPWLAIGLEEHARNPHAPAIHGADDLILMPLDKSVFQQKVEYLIAGAEKISPSFLYLAKSELEIELAKSVHITHISETSCTIVAPRPLARGVEGTLLSPLFGEGPLQRVEVRAIDSNPYFDSSLAASHGAAREPSFEVKLRFFGLKHSQLLALRKWLSIHFPHGLPEILRSKNPPKNSLRTIMISPQKSLAMVVRSALENLAQIEIEQYAGFKRLQGELLMKHQTKVAADAALNLGPTSTRITSRDFVGPKTRAQATPAVPHDQATLYVRLPSETAPGVTERITPPLAAHETLFGSPTSAWTNDTGLVSKYLRESDREGLNEAIQWTIANTTLTAQPEVEIKADLEIPEVLKSHVTFTVSVAEVATPSRAALIKIHITESRDHVELADGADEGKPCEAILVDGSLLDLDLKAKMIQLGDWLETFDLRNSFGNRPPIVVFNANETRVQAQDFRGTKVRQLVYDFDDRRFQAELFISMSRAEHWTSPLLAISDLKTDLKAYLGRPAKASGVSEVSLMITDRAPLRRGTELLVLSPLWSEAPEGLWARLRSASPKEDLFENEFIFFGVSDLVQKEIRKFARADYIKKKAQGQS